MKDLRTDVVKKALTDPKFKAELLKSPNSAVEAATGVKVPAGTTVKVVEDTASVVHLVLPVLAAAPKGALSEKDLETVSGGASGLPATLKLIMNPCDNTAGRLASC